MSHRPLAFVPPFVLLALFAASAPTSAVEQHFKVEPQKSGVEFTVDARLHLVEGKMPIAGGELHFDPETGQASGQVAADARRADTGSGMRDKTMHGDVLLSATFPTVVFTAEGFEGAAIPEGASRAKLRGRFTMIGRDHPVTLEAQLVRSGQNLTATAKFPVPFREWGLKDPSLLFLRLANDVQVTVRLVGALAP